MSAPNIYTSATYHVRGSTEKTARRSRVATRRKTAKTKKKNIPRRRTIATPWRRRPLSWHEREEGENKFQSYDYKREDRERTSAKCQSCEYIVQIINTRCPKKKKKKPRCPKKKKKKKKK